MLLACYKNYYCRNDIVASIILVKINLTLSYSAKIKIIWKGTN